MILILTLISVILFIVLATAKYKFHPFIVLISASFLAAFLYGLPSSEIVKIITGGFGSILGYIGLVITIGTIIGVILEKSGAAITMADTIIKLFGDKFPTLTMAIIGYIVSIPVFCDSGFVILNSLKESISKRLNTSSIAMSIALAGGLYATHTFVPPTPGPIAAAGNLGVQSNLGFVVGIGLLVSAVASLAGIAWANQFKDTRPDVVHKLDSQQQSWQQLKESYGQLPNPIMAFSPIFIPILLICLASIAKLSSQPFGQGGFYNMIILLGEPVAALLFGLLLSTCLLRGGDKIELFSKRVSEGLVSCAPILLITGAGGAFGAVLKATELGSYLGESLSSLGVGIFMPFVVAAALKSAQGSSTVAIVTTSALVAPMLEQLGLGTEIGRVLTVMAIGAGAMTVSHANDSFFWIVSQFSRMSVELAYRAHTVATLIQGIVAMTFIYILRLILLP